jgi:hypothetical protein
MPLIYNNPSIQKNLIRFGYLWGKYFGMRQLLFRCIHGFRIWIGANGSVVRHGILTALPHAGRQGMSRTAGLLAFTIALIAQPAAFTEAIFR